MATDKLELSTPNWDPTPAKRCWYRSQQTGDRGYMVRRNGTDVIRLDRAGVEVLRKFDASWVPDNDAKPMRPIDLLRVIHAADVALCEVLGLHRLKPKAWLAMSDKERLEWMEFGPPTTNPLRVAVYKALHGTLQGVTK